MGQGLYGELIHSIYISHTLWKEWAYSHPKSPLK